MTNFYPIKEILTTSGTGFQFRANLKRGGIIMDMESIPNSIRAFVNILEYGGFNPTIKKYESSSITGQNITVFVDYDNKKALNSFFFEFDMNGKLNVIGNID